jgi:hypothetical protein
MVKHTIKDGENLEQIANMYGTTVDAIMEANSYIKNPNLIYANDLLTIPSTSNSNANTENKNTGFTYNPFEYKDFEESEDLTNAGINKNNYNANLESMNNAGFTYDKQLQEDDIWNKIFGREKFNFNFNEDALYQQYKDKYIKQGKMAMQDTIGQASAMTGGYGNSYAQSVGNQAYQASLEQLNDVIPELYQMAYDRYQQEGQDLYNKYSMLSNDKEQKYGMWNDKYNRLAGMRDYYQADESYLYNKERGEYESDRTFEQGLHDTKESYRYQNWADQIAQEQWEKGYDLQERQLQMAEEEWAYKQDSYQKAQESTEKLGKGRSGGISYDNGNLTTAQIKAIQIAIGVEADGKYGGESRYKAGNLSAEEAYKKFVGVKDNVVEAPKEFTLLIL